MYQLSVSPFGPYQRYAFLNPETGSGFSIVPEAGANVLDLHFQGQNVLDGHETPEELQAAKWGKSAVLFPFPNRLRDGRYTWLGQEYHFPINNAATQNAIHGFVRQEAFLVDQITLTRSQASLVCSFRYEGQHAAYPFPFFLELTFVLEAKRFILKAKCLNLHGAPIPVGFGWHPYFKLTHKADDHTMRLPLCQKIDIDERMIPTGQRTDFPDFARARRVGDTFLDNCFAANQTGPYALVLEAGGRHLSVKATQQQCPFFQVFTPPHRESIALEPMSCNVDAFHNGDGLATLQPGKTWRAAMSIALRS